MRLPPAREGAFTARPVDGGPGRTLPGQQAQPTRLHVQLLCVPSPPLRRQVTHQL